MIARRFSEFSDREDIVIFASGVSNSKETQAEPYERERHLVEATLRQHPDSLFVYFSTASIADPTEQGSPYVTHKLELEQLIASQATHYLLVRASNVVGGPGNPHTVLNFFVDRIRHSQPFTVWQHASRNLIDLDDVYQVIVSHIHDPSTWNQLIVVANPESVSPLAIVRAIEQHTGKTAIYQLVDKGTPFVLPAGSISNILHTTDRDWQPEYYVAQLLQKYYV